MESDGPLIISGGCIQRRHTAYMLTLYAFDCAVKTGQEFSGTICYIFYIDAQHPHVHEKGVCAAGKFEELCWTPNVS